MTIEIGALLRKARVERSMSLRSLATEVGLSPSLISQVETGKTQPSVSTLYTLSNFLGLSIDELLANDLEVGAEDYSHSPSAGMSRRDHQRPIQRGQDNPRLEMDNGVIWERLAISDDALTEPILVTYSPGASSSIEGKLMRHGGHEYAYLIEGELTLQLEFETYVLTPGDSLQFDASRPHMYFNHGNAPARGVWHVIGRRQQNQSLPVAPEYQISVARRNISAITSAIDALNAMENVATN
ncbi:MAG: helix-turn-helix domain-containing protein [Acidimicrobiaceae bacterium]|nr:helix-turn-helix domain-containing protein [Acidimicrobiaceae bacterium]